VFFVDVVVKGSFAKVALQTKGTGCQSPLGRRFGFPDWPWSPFYEFILAAISGQVIRSNLRL
jgi:hypothetical protein